MLCKRASPGKMEEPIRPMGKGGVNNAKKSLLHYNSLTNPNPAQFTPPPLLPRLKWSRCKEIPLESLQLITPYFTCVSFKLFNTWPMHVAILGCKLNYICPQ